jgi:YfiH family protein
LEHTYINRVRSFDVFNRHPESVYDVWQVHSADVICATDPRPKNMQHKKADAILTDNPGLTLFMRFADCVPILLFDPVVNVVGLAHAGWQGTVKNIAAAAVEKMVVEYGSVPKDIRAGIGPSIGPHHYEVGPEVAEQATKTFGHRSAEVLINKAGKIYFDLWSANRILLECAGLTNIELSGLCTACDPYHWFSHRGENGSTGRFGALIALDGNP